MPNVLLLGDSYSNQNLFYKTGFLSNNPFVYLGFEGSSCVDSFIVTTYADYERALSESFVSSVYTFNEFDYVSKIRRYGHKDLAFLFMLDEILGRYKLKRVTVPKDFPFFFANGLIKLGRSIMIDCDLFVRERSIKTAEELECIRVSQRALEGAMAVAEGIISVSSEGLGRRLIYDGEYLTTSFLKHEIAKSLFERSCNVFDIIVACGKDGADPHFSGESYLYSCEPIMIDIFPYHSRTRYFSDMTRTFVKGEASLVLHSMYDAVLGAQELAISSIRSGVSALDIYSGVCDYFNSCGYKTLREQSPDEPLLRRGFIHSLGHGLGLNIHEVPFLFNQDIKLEEGNVITVEPGLYDPSLGGIRVEDLVLVCEGGYELLTDYHKDFVLCN